jgi:hypothetical protein
MSSARLVTSASAVRHLHPVRAVVFPSEAKVPEGTRHFELRTFLYQVLKLAFAAEAGIGSDQFVYYDGRSPRRCLAPDVFVHVGAPHVAVMSWKTWERGVPQLCVEIVSDPETEIEEAWDAKLERYHELGAFELVLFDPEGQPGRRLRVWDRVDDDLVERVVEHDRTPCLTLDLHWVVVPVGEHPAGLRLARDAEGRDLLPTEAEAAHGAREAAERRVAELEEELRRR